MELEKGKVYNLLAGIYVAGCGDVVYLSNMMCMDVTSEGFRLQGVPGSTGSLKGPLFVYKDEIFGIFDKDLYECLTHG
jgi:hypothetical protein